jgi:hypothetical protein
MQMTARRTPVPTDPTESDCNLDTDFNSIVPGSVVAGKEHIIQMFRVRALDYTNALFAQQGVFIPLTPVGRGVSSLDCSCPRRRRCED